jgi:2'-5' RNA ligase
MPAHITLLYPFKSPNEIDEAVLDTLRHCFSGFTPFEFSLTAINRFPGETLYLVPEPEDPFRQLTLAIWGRYPETPPYGGRYSTIVPHLTAAQLVGEQRLGQVARKLEQASQERLPIRAQAAEVALMDTRSGRWEINTAFKLGQGVRWLGRLGSSDEDRSPPSGDPVVSPYSCNWGSQTSNRLLKNDGRGTFARPNILLTLNA